MMVLPAGTSTARAMGKVLPPSSGWRTTSAALATPLAASANAQPTAARIRDADPDRLVMATPLFQRVDVGHDIDDGLLIGKRADDGAHLRAVCVAGIGATQAFLVVRELRREIPVRACGQRW